MRMRILKGRPTTSGYHNDKGRQGWWLHSVEADGAELWRWFRDGKAMETIRCVKGER